jgi:hypothetical protein
MRRAVIFKVVVLKAPMPNRALVWLLLLPWLISCTHNNSNSNNNSFIFVPPNNCLTQLIGFKDSSRAALTNYNEVINIGFLDRSTGNILSSFNADSGTVDPNDHQSCILNNTLFFLLRNNSAPGSVLKAIDITTQLPLNIYLPAWYLSLLVYNNNTATFYARSHYTSGDSLASFSLSGNTVSSYRNIAGIPSDVNSITIDQTTGKLYLSAGTTVAHLYTFSANILSEITLSDNSSVLYGLRFSSSDNALYAFNQTALFKINAANGTRTSIMPFSRTISNTVYSGVVDDCNKQMIISSCINAAPDTGLLMVYDFTAAKMATYYLPFYSYMGLAIK